MKIAHLPIQIAGAPAILSAEHNRLGHEAFVVDAYPTWLGYPAGRIVPEAARSVAAAWKEAVWVLNQAPDVVQAWFGMSLAPNYQDLAIARHMGIRVAMMHCGSDVRRKEQALKYSKWARPKPTDEAHVDAMLKACSRVVPLGVCTEARLAPFITPYYRTVRHVPFVVDVDAFPFQMRLEHRERPLVVHAPTDRSFKGTDHILAALDRLRAKGVPFDLDLVEGVPHAEARARFAAADVVVDQVCDGGIGAFAGECMAQGTPVVAYLCDAWRETVPEPAPIASAEPDRLDGVLGDLLVNPALRADIGHRGARWIRRWHSPRSVGQALLDVWSGATDHLGPYASCWFDAETGERRYTTAGL